MPLTLEQPVGLKPEWDEDILSAHAAPKQQSERIRQWAQRAYRNRNAYGEETAAKVTAALARAGGSAGSGQTVPRPQESKA